MITANEYNNIPVWSSQLKHVFCEGYCCVQQEPSDECEASTQRVQIVISSFAGLMQAGWGLTPKCDLFNFGERSAFLCPECCEQYKQSDAEKYGALL